MSLPVGFPVVGCYFLQKQIIADGIGELDLPDSNNLSQTGLV
jgi:hypothetical protein